MLNGLKRQMHRYLQNNGQYCNCFDSKIAAIARRWKLIIFAVYTSTCASDYERSSRVGKY